MTPTPCRTQTSASRSFGPLAQALTLAPALALAIGMLTACASSASDTVNHAAANRTTDRPGSTASLFLPPDFGVDITVIQPTANTASANHSDSPLPQTARYILETDRTLRVGLGPGAAIGGFPPIWTRLSRLAVADLWRQIDRDHLFAEPTSPLAEIALRQADQDVQRLRARVPFYRIRLAGNGREHAYWTTAAESPPTDALVQALRQAAGLDPAGRTKP